MNLSQFVADGSLIPDSWLVLHRRGGVSMRAKVLSDGNLQTEDGKVHSSPSGAAKHLLGRGVDGWLVWRLSDGRVLADLRSPSE
jgi:hypothetical protein